MFLHGSTLKTRLGQHLVMPQLIIEEGTWPVAQARELWSRAKVQIKQEI